MTKSPKDPSSEITQLVIPPITLERAQAASQTVLEVARGIVITSDSEYAAAAEFRRECIAEPRRQLAEDFKPVKQGLDREHKRVCALEKKYDAPFKLAQEIVDSLMFAWQDERKRQKEEEQRLLTESLRQDAEREAAEEAAELIASGDDEAAEEILTSLATGKVELAVAPPPMINTPLKVQGTSFRTLKRFEMLDESKLKRAYLIPDEKLIQNAVNAHGYDAERIVGEGSIRVYDKPSIGSRR